MESIFNNNNFYNLSDPQGTWLFDVSFYSVKNNTNSTKFADFCKTDLIVTSVSLPSYKTDIVTKKWFGSEKSFPVIRTYGGDCTMKFDVRSDNGEMLNTEKLAQIDALFHSEGQDYILYHPELESVVNGLAFQKVIVRLKNKTVSANTDESISAEYEYNNCIITEFGFNEELDYSSDSKLTCKLTFHYDMWHKTKGINGI